MTLACNFGRTGGREIKPARAVANLILIAGLFSTNQVLAANILGNLSSFQRDLVNGAYADAQLLSFESTSGWFFWSYKLESDSEWNFRYCVERGWLPDSFPD